MRFHTLFLGLAALCCAGPAQAHTFLPEGGFYDRFVEGNLVVLAYPIALLPLIALGLLITLWDTEGLVRVWPALIVGQLAGIGLASAVGPEILVGLMTAGVLVAGLAALLPKHALIEVQLAALSIGTCVVAASLEGHGLFELPLAIHLGILCAANIVVAIASALPRLTFESSDAVWVRIGWRVAASWIGAVLILYLAFTLAS